MGAHGILDERKRQVLAAIVREYVQTAEPVSSQRVVERQGIRASAATVRHEMAILEEWGYIYQPHASAGRLPSDLGYRYFVDEILRPRHLSQREREWIRQKYAQIREDGEEILRATCAILAHLTGYTAVVFTPALRETLLRYIEMAPLDRHRLLILLVTDGGHVQHRLVAVERAPDSKALLRLTRLLNTRLAGRRLSLLEEVELSHLWQEAKGYNEVLHQVLRLLKRTALEEGKAQVFVDGIVSILEQPEFQEVSRAREVLLGLQGEEGLRRSLKEAAERGRGLVGVGIGCENPVSHFRSCSIVSTPYSLASGAWGYLGVIGPTRMRYGRAMQVLESTRLLLEEALQGMAGR